MESPWTTEDSTQRRFGEPEQEIDIVQKYLEEISQYPLLTKVEEVALSKRVQAGLSAQATLVEYPEQDALLEVIEDGKQAKDAFVLANLRLVVSIAKKFRQSEVPLLDLIQEGNIGLAHAVDLFDWRKGFKFSTYATWWVRQYIDRSIAGTKDTIRIPVHTVDDITRLNRLERQDLDDATIMEYMGMCSEQIKQLRQWRSLQPLSFSMELGEDGYQLGDTIKDPLSDYGYEQAEDRIVKDGLNVLLDKILSPREKLLISLRYGLEGNVPLSLEAVGNLILGEDGQPITRERVRQIERTALLKLKHPALHREIVKVFPVDIHENTWMESAACAGSAALMLATTDNRGRPTKNTRYEKEPTDQRVQKFCHNCPVLGECQAFAYKVKPHGGVWGGVRHSSRG
jgi:RNA polymerase primary sigma factor